jgi:hypothetical protein
MLRCTRHRTGTSTSLTGAPAALIAWLNATSVLPTGESALLYFPIVCRRRSDNDDTLIL